MYIYTYISNRKLIFNNKNETIEYNKEIYLFFAINWDRHSDSGGAELVFWYTKSTFSVFSNNTRETRRSFKIIIEILIPAKELTLKYNYSEFVTNV